MPTTTFYRIWCKTCKEYTLHHRKRNYPNPDSVSFFCNDCNSEHVETPLNEIPEEYRFEQRKRYTESRQNEIFGSELIKGFFSPPKHPLFGGWEKPEIIEDDAGQAAIDAVEDEKRAEERKLRIAEQERQYEERLKYINLGRNDLCACGSGQKYKKCKCGAYELYN